MVRRSAQIATQGNSARKARHLAQCARWGGRRKPRRWTKQEDESLRRAVAIHGEKHWKDIARSVETRNHVQCLQRWKKVLRPGLKKGHWGPEEDELLRRLVEMNGKDKWGEVASQISGRTAKQCRERW